MVASQLGFSKVAKKRQDGICVDYLGLVLNTEKIVAQLLEDKKE